MTRQAAGGMVYIAEKARPIYGWCLCRMPFIGTKGQPPLPVPVRNPIPGPESSSRMGWR